MWLPKGLHIAKIISWTDSEIVAETVSAAPENGNLQVYVCSIGFANAESGKIQLVVNSVSGAFFTKLFYFFRFNNNQFLDRRFELKEVDVNAKEWAGIVTKSLCGQDFLLYVILRISDSSSESESSDVAIRSGEDEVLINPPSDSSSTPENFESPSSDNDPELQVFVDFETQYFFFWLKNALL